jgi:hypothetical protein
VDSPIATTEIYKIIIRTTGTIATTITTGEEEEESQSQS